jgi:hypothetical protein
MELADLPDELHVHIFSFLAVADLCRCGSDSALARSHTHASHIYVSVWAGAGAPHRSVEVVCRQWRRLAAEGSLWRALMLADCRSVGRVRQSIAERAASAEARISDHMLLFHHTSPHLLPSALRPATAHPSSADGNDDLATDVRHQHAHAHLAVAHPDSGSWKQWYRGLRDEEENWATGRYRTSDETALASRKFILPSARLASHQNRSLARTHARTHVLLSCGDAPPLGRPHHPEGCEYLDVSGRYVVSGGWGLGLKVSLRLFLLLRLLG